MVSWNRFGYYLTFAFFLLQQLGLDYVVAKDDLLYLILLLPIDICILFALLFNHSVDFAATKGGTCWVLYSWGMTVKLGVMYFTEIATTLDEPGLVIRRLRGRGTEVDLLFLLAPLIYALLAFRGFEELFGDVGSISTESMFHGNLVLHVMLDWWDIVAAFSTFSLLPPLLARDGNWLHITVGVVLCVATFLHAYSFPTVGAASGQEKGEQVAAAAAQSGGGDSANTGLLRDAGDVFITRKHAAVVGACFIDVPLTVFRTFLWILHPTYEGLSPFVIKNITSFMMQGITVKQVITATRLKELQQERRAKPKSTFTRELSTASGSPPMGGAGTGGDRGGDRSSGLSMAAAAAAAETEQTPDRVEYKRVKFAGATKYSDYPQRQALLRQRSSSSQPELLRLTPPAMAKRHAAAAAGGGGGMGGGVGTRAGRQHHLPPGGESPACVRQQQLSTPSAATAGVSVPPSSTYYTRTGAWSASAPTSPTAHQGSGSAGGFAGESSPRTPHNLQGKQQSNALNHLATGTLARDDTQYTLERGEAELEEVESLIGDIYATKAPRSIPPDPVRNSQLLRMVVHCTRFGGRHTLAVLLDDVLHIPFWKRLRLAFPFMMMWLSQIAIVAVLFFVNDSNSWPPDGSNRHLDTLRFPIQLFDTQTILRVSYSSLPTDVSICFIIVYAAMVSSLVLWIFSAPLLDVLLITVFGPLQLFSFFLVVLTFRDFAVFDNIFYLKTLTGIQNIGRYFLWAFVLEPAVGVLYTLYPFLCALMNKHYLGYVVPVSSVLSLATRISSMLGGSWRVGGGGQHRKEKGGWSGGGGVLVGDADGERQFGGDNLNRPKRGDEVGLMTTSSMIVFLNCRFALAPISLHELLIGPNLVKSFRLTDALLYTHFRYLCIACVVRLWCLTLYCNFPASIAYGFAPAYTNIVLPGIHNSHPTFDIAAMCFSAHVAILIIYAMLSQVVRLLAIRRYELKAMFEEIADLVKRTMRTGDACLPPPVVLCDPGSASATAAAERIGDRERSGERDRGGGGGEKRRSVYGSEATGFVSAKNKDFTESASFRPSAPKPATACAAARGRSGSWPENSSQIDLRRSTTAGRGVEHELARFSVSEEMDWIVEKYKRHAFYTTPGSVLPNFF